MQNKNVIFKFKVPILVAFIFIFLLASGCYEVYVFNTQVKDNKIVFTSSLIKENQNDNYFYLTELHVDKILENRHETMWSVKENDNFNISSETSLKVPITYGVPPIAMHTVKAPKKLTRGNYRVSGWLVVYNKNKKMVASKLITDKFVLGLNPNGEFKIN